MGKKTGTTPKKTRAGTEYDLDINIDELENVPTGTQMFRTPPTQTTRAKISSIPREDVTSANASSAETISQMDLIKLMFDKLERIEARLDNRDRQIGSNIHGVNPTGPRTSATAVRSNTVTSEARTEAGNLPGPVVRLPRGGFLKNPFSDIEFAGDPEKQNPVRFIQKFERIASYENVEDPDKLYYFEKR